MLTTPATKSFVMRWGPPLASKAPLLSRTFNAMPAVAILDCPRSTSSSSFASNAARAASAPSMRLRHRSLAHGGAEERLMEVFGRPGDQPTFGVGTFGSVWCDVELVGVVGTRTFERTVRVAPWKDPRTGVWEVMLDNTLCDTW